MSTGLPVPPGCQSALFGMPRSRTGYDEGANFPVACQDLHTLLGAAVACAAQLPQPALSPRFSDDVFGGEGSAKKKLIEPEKKIPPPVPCGSSFGNPLIE